MNTSLSNSKKSFLFLLSALICSIGCNGDSNSENILSETLPSTPDIPYTVTNSYLHDKTLFTEGFVYYDHKLFESTGSPEDLPNLESKIGFTDLKTGSFSQKIQIDKKKYFGEGIVFLNGRLFQLTYKNHLGFVYDATTFKLIKTFSFINAEGWGLTTDGHYLIMSDGSSTLTYLDPASLKPIKTINVLENNLRRDSLNELEVIKGFIYANIWQNNVIVKIDPKSGQVVGRLDINPLSFKMHVLNPEADVANGIAFDSTTGKVYLSGKLWPYIFEIKME